MQETFSGPIVIFGQQPPTPGLSGDYNADLGPSGFAIGTGLVDPRFGCKTGSEQGSTAVYLFMNGGDICTIAAAPSAAGVATVAAAQTVTSGAALTMAGSAGVVATTSAFTVPQTGAVVPSGAMTLDGLPATILFGPNTTVGVADPRYALARAVSITAPASAVGGAFLVSGYDLYGMPQTETITAAAATTASGHKGFKWIASVTPQFTDATYTYSVGTLDVFDFPLLASDVSQVRIFWAGTLETASTGFTAGSSTSPATSTSGSARGTYATPSASNGTNELVIYQSIAPWNAATQTGVFGVTPA